MWKEDRTAFDSNLRSSIYFYLSSTCALVGSEKLENRIYNINLRRRFYDRLEPASA